MNPFHHALLADVFQKQTIQVNDIIWSGLYGNLITPKSAYYNGATYVTGQKGSASEYSPVILKYKNGIIEFANAGVVDNSDPLNHQHPTVLIIDSYVYVFFVNGHGEDIKIYKSNSPESVKDGFTLHHTIPGMFGYCNPRLLDDGRVVITSRLTEWAESDSTQTNYSQIFTISTDSTLTSWTTKNTTITNYSTDKVRHYPVGMNIYGNNSWFYLGISMRYDGGSPEKFFGYAFYKTQDFSTFHNLSETFSKNIDTSGQLTKAEIENNLMLVGSNTAATVYTGPSNAMVIDDTIYDAFFDQTEGVWKFIKIDSSGTVSYYPCAIPVVNESTITVPLAHPFTFYFNGSNIVFIVDEGVKKNLYKCDLNFANFTLVHELNNPEDDIEMNRPVIPFNLPEVTGNYLIGGTRNDGYFPYFITNDKYLL